MGKTDHTHIRLDNQAKTELNGNGLAQTLDAVTAVQYNGEEILKEELRA